jgi:hypothetical protein
MSGRGLIPPLRQQYSSATVTGAVPMPLEKEKAQSMIIVPVRDEDGAILAVIQVIPHNGLIIIDTGL